MATRETKRTKPVTKRLAKADTPAAKADAPAAKPRTRRLTKSLALIAEAVPVPTPEAGVAIVATPEPVVAIAPMPLVAPEPAPAPVVAISPPEPPRAREPFAPIVRSTGGSRRALDTGDCAWVSVVYEGGATFCDDQAGIFVNGTRTRLRAPIAERLLTLDGFRMP